MANRIVLKRSSVANKVPLASDLVAGELAVNLTDKLLYTKDGAGNVVTVGGSSGGGSGTVTGVTATAPVVSSGGTAPVISMAAANTTTPGYLTAADWNTFNGKQAALGFTPYNATNPSGYISSITSANVTTALGYTPYNSSNPSGYITSSSLSSYLPLSGGTLSGVLTSSIGGYGRVNGNDQYHAIVLRGTVSGTTSQTVTAGDYMEFIEYGGVWNFRQINATGTNSVWATINTSGITWNGNQVLHAGNYTSYSPSLTGSGASGTWGINVTGTAGSISGYNNPATGATANTIVYRDGSGHISGNYLFGNYINTGDDVSSGTLTYLMGKFGDNYHRSATAAKVAAFLSGQTMNINGSSTSCSGNAASASSVAWGNVSSKPSSVFYYAGWATDANTVASNSSSFCYSVNAAATGPLAYFDAAGYGLQLSCGYGDGSNFYWRVRNGDNGTWQSWRRFLTEDIWINNKHFGSDGNIYSNASMRAGIFYDQNDTGYYCDPNGTSNFQNITSRTKDRFGLSGRYNTPRSDYNGDSAYWGGQMGWGTTDLNTVNDWGCGFWDSWGGPANQPSGTSHWDGINVQHHPSYGWQMAMGAGAPGLLWVRGHWGGGWDGWYKVALYDNNSYTDRAFYAAVYYDANNTGYYVDPNNTSRMNAVVADNLYAYGTVTAYYSDDRLKTRFSNIADALDKVCSLNGFFYVGHSVAESLGYKKKMAVGLSAQEVQRILPEVVVPAPVDENYLTIQYDRVVPLLVEAIKELRNEINQLKSLKA